MLIARGNKILQKYKCIFIFLSLSIYNPRNKSNRVIRKKFDRSYTKIHIDSIKPDFRPEMQQHQGPRTSSFLYEMCCCWRLHILRTTIQNGDSREWVIFSPLPFIYTNNKIKNKFNRVTTRHIHCSNYHENPQSALIFREFPVYRLRNAYTKVPCNIFAWQFDKSFFPCKNSG